jgi:hypothetical protein
LKAVHDYIQVDNSQFIKSVEESLSSKQTQDVKAQKKRLAECQQRAQELETLLCKIYEDNILGKLPDKRYQMLSQQYEKEQAELEQTLAAAKEELSAMEKTTSEADQFIRLAKKYPDLTKLTAPILNEFVDKILVHEPEKIDGERSQEIEVHLKFIGRFDLPAPELTAEELAEEQKLRERRAKNRESTRRYYERKRQQRAEMAQAALA